MEIPASVMSLKKLLINSSFNLTFHTPCLELKVKVTSHGKGVLDGVGGKVKSTIQRKVMSQGKNRLIVQDAESFASAAKILISSTKIIQIGEPEIVTYKDRNPF